MTIAVCGPTTTTISAHGQSNESLLLGKGFPERVDAILNRLDVITISGALAADTDKMFFRLPRLLMYMHINLYSSSVNNFMTVNFKHISTYYYRK